MPRCRRSLANCCGFEDAPHPTTVPDRNQGRPWMAWRDEFSRDPVFGPDPVTHSLKRKRKFHDDLPQRETPHRPFGDLEQIGHPKAVNSNFEALALRTAGETHGARRSEGGRKRKKRDTLSKDGSPQRRGVFTLFSSPCFWDGFTMFSCFCGRSNMFPFLETRRTMFF